MSKNLVSIYSILIQNKIDSKALLILVSGLAMSEEDREILRREVNIVFHSAATVRFDDLLTRSVSMNVRGTKELMDLAKEMKNLISFVHVSTCYVHCHRQNEVIREEIYPPENYSVKEVLDMCEHNTGMKVSTSLKCKY